MATKPQPAPTEIILTNHDKLLRIYCSGETSNVIPAWIDSVLGIHEGAEMLRCTGDHEAEVRIALKRYLPRSILTPAIDRLIKVLTLQDGTPPNVHTIVEIDDVPVDLPELIFNPSRQEINDLLIHGHAEDNVPELFVLHPLLNSK
jgi:hypothetical protein